MVESTSNLISATNNMEQSLKNATESLDSSLDKFTTETNETIKNLEKMFDKALDEIKKLRIIAHKTGIKVRADPTSISIIPKGRGCYFAYCRRSK
ncbi:MAG: hypothetical protein ACTSYZ_01530 [Candidatus Helarchaeota archaeon]